MAFRRTWQMVQKQATQAMKSYAEEKAKGQDEVAKRHLVLAQGLVREALKLDKRGPLKPE